MTQPTVAELEHLAQTYGSTIAPWLAFGVQHAYKGMVADLIGGLGVQELRALCVVLAEAYPQPHARPDDGIVDQVAVERAAAGEQVPPLSESERLAVMRLMSSRGVAARVIAQRLHVAVETVQGVVGSRELRAVDPAGAVRDVA